METEKEQRRARLEKMVATTRLRLALETEEEGRAKKRDVDLIWIEIGVFNNKIVQGMSSLAHFSSIYIYVCLRLFMGNPHTNIRMLNCVGGIT